MQSDISDWSITFVDTGLASPIGERLRRVRTYLGGDEYFLANYADVLTDAPIGRFVEKFHQSGAAASMMIVPPQSSFHCVDVSEAGEVKDIMAVSELPIWENGGFFVLSQEVFDYLPPGGTLSRTPAGRWPGRAAVRLSVRRLLEARRHLQGTSRTRRPIRTGRPSVDGLGPCRGDARSPPHRAHDRTQDGCARPKSRSWEHIATTSRSGWAAPCSRLAKADPDCVCAGLCCPAGAPNARPRRRNALAAFCPGADVELTVFDVPDGRAPAHWDRIKDCSERLSQILHPRRSSVRSVPTLIRITGCSPSCYQPSFAITSCSATRSSSGRPTPRARRSFTRSPASPKRRRACC